MARTRVLVAGLMVVGALGLSGCSDGAARAGTQPTAVSTDTAEKEQAPEYDTTWNELTPTMAKDAVARYGAKGVAQGTSTAVDFAEDHSFDQEMLRARLGEHVDAVLAMTRSMGSSAANDWTHAVYDYNSGKAGRDRSGGLVMSLTLYAAWSMDKPDTMYVAPNGPAAVDPRLVSVRSSLDDRGRLAVDVKSSADVRLVVKKKPVRMKISRTQTFWMVKARDGWKIDGWTGSLKAGQYRPDK